MHRTGTDGQQSAAPRVELTDQYRPIGPAAVLAALLCAAKTPKPGLRKAA